MQSAIVSAATTAAARIRAGQQPAYAIRCAATEYGCSMGAVAGAVGQRGGRASGRVSARRSRLAAVDVAGAWWQK